MSSLPARAGAVSPSATLVALLTGYFALQPLATDLYLASLPSMPAAFATDAAHVQGTLSLFMLAFGAGQLVAGPLADRYGRRPLLSAGLSLYVVAAGLALVADTIGALLALRVVQGVGAACCMVAGRAVVRDHFAPERGARTFALVSTFTALVSIVGPPAGGFLEHAVGYRGSFAVMTLVGAIVLAQHLRRLPESLAVPAAVHPRALVAGYAAVARDRGFRTFTLLVVASYAGLFAFLSNGPRLFIERYGVAPEGFGFAYASAVVGYIGGTIACRRMLPRHGLVHVVRLASFGSLAAGALLALVAQRELDGPWTIVLPFTLYMAAHGVIAPCAYAGAAAAFRDRAGAASALTAIVQMSAAALVAQALAQRSDTGAWPLLMTIAVASAALFAIAQALVPREAGRLAAIER